MLGVLRLELCELPLPDERPRVGAVPVLNELGDGGDASGAGELTELGEFFVAVHALCEDAENEPTLWLRPRRGIGLARCHSGIMPL